MPVWEKSIDDNFDQARVVKETLKATQKHIVLLLVGAFVLKVIPQMMSWSFMSEVYFSKALVSPMYWVGFLIATVSGFMFQGYVAYIVVRSHRGIKTNIQQAFVLVLRKAFPLFFLAILMSLGIGLSSFLLLVPGILIGVMWSVSVPVMVLEDSDPFRALNRSIELTVGSRWQTFGLFIVAFLISLALSLAVYSFNPSEMMADLIVPSLPTLIALILVDGLTAIVFGCGIASIYSELRFVKEGVNNYQVASVFE